MAAPGDPATLMVRSCFWRPEPTLTLKLPPAVALVQEPKVFGHHSRGIFGALLIGVGMPVPFLVEELRWFSWPLTLGTVIGGGPAIALAVGAFEVAKDGDVILGSILAPMAATMALGMPAGMVLFMRETR